MGKGVGKGQAGKGLSPANISSPRNLALSRNGSDQCLKGGGSAASKGSGKGAGSAEKSGRGGSSNAYGLPAHLNLAASNLGGSQFCRPPSSPGAEVLLAKQLSMRANGKGGRGNNGGSNDASQGKGTSLDSPCLCARKPATLPAVHALLVSGGQGVNQNRSKGGKGKGGKGQLSPEMERGMALAFAVQEVGALTNTAPNPPHPQQ